jgi:hypothetical protein
MERLSKLSERLTDAVGMRSVRGIARVAGVDRVRP